MAADRTPHTLAGSLDVNPHRDFPPPDYRYVILC